MKEYKNELDEHMEMIRFAGQFAAQVILDVDIHVNLQLCKPFVKQVCYFFVFICNLLNKITLHCTTRKKGPSKCHSRISMMIISWGCAVITNDRDVPPSP